MTLDPCGRDPTPEQRVNCEANGVPGGSYVQSDGDIHLVSAAAIPRSSPSRAIHSTWGWMGARATALEFARPTISRPASTISYRCANLCLILEECANRASTVACANIERFEDGSLDSVDTRQSNFGRVTVTGIDLAAQLHVTMRAGDAGARLIATHLLEHDSQAFQGGTTISNAGRANVGMLLPRWRALGGVDWTHGDWRLGYSLQFIGAVDACSVALDGTPYCAPTGSVLYHDIELAYRWHELGCSPASTTCRHRNHPFSTGAPRTPIRRPTVC